MIKLISCHVENFGKINSLDIDFQSGLTEIIKENGYGKTTIASFIKAMFFGMPSTRISDKDLGTRQRYYPFSGGLFGGNLSYEKEGKVYKIERFFDRKSDTKDLLKVYENNSLISNSQDFLGEKLFEMNEDTFIRTLFITSEQIEVSSNSQISSKLNNIIDNTDETNNFSTAFNIIEEEQKKYKYRGDKGLIKDKTQEILSIRQEISNLENVKATLEYKYLELKSLKEQLDSLEKQFTSINSSVALLENFKLYDSLLNDAKIKERELKELESAYNFSVIDKNFIQNLKKNAETAYLESQKLNTLKNGNGVAQKLNEISSSLGGKIPTDEEVLQIDDKIKEVKVLEMQVQNKKGKNGFNFLFATFLALMLVGVGVAFANVLIGGILGCLGGIGVIISLCLPSQKSANKQAVKRVEQLKFEIGNFFNKLRYSAVNYENDLVDLKSKVNLYRILQKELEDKNKAIFEQENNLNGLVATLSDMIKSVGLEVKPNVKGAVDSIDSIFAKYERLKERATDATLKAKCFKEEKKLSIRPTITEQEISEITINLKTIQNEYYKKLKIVSDDEKVLDGLAILKAKLEILEEELEVLKSEYSIYTKTLEFLKNAEDNLHQKYIAPIKERFSYYASKLEKALNEKTFMDKDFKISFERNGQQFSYKHLSFGTLAISNLCLRLALIDNMFKGNVPFIILDDPFIGLDEVHFDNMKKLIKELSCDRQIIYFTCHNSRSIS